MPRKKNTENLAENLLSGSRKKRKSIFLEPPLEIEQVIVRDSIVLASKNVKSKTASRSILITNMQHAPSRHVLNLNTLSLLTGPRVTEKTASTPRSAIEEGGSVRKDNTDPRANIFRGGRLPHSTRFSRGGLLGKIKKLSAARAYRLGAKKETRFFGAATNTAALIIVSFGKNIFPLLHRASRPLAWIAASLDFLATHLYGLGKQSQAVRSLQFANRETKSHMKRRESVASPVSLFSLPFGWHRAIASFVLVSMVFVLPLKALSFYSDMQITKVSVAERGKDGLSEILGAIHMAKDSPESAAGEFEKASLTFGEAQAELQKINALVLELSKLRPETNKQIENGALLISTAENLTSAAAIFASAAPIFKTQANLIDKLAAFRTHVAEALPYIRAADTNLSKIDPRVFGLAERDASIARGALSGMSYSLQEFVNFGDKMLELLGAGGLKKYLFVFQNNTELRPTGGFIGSMAEVTIDRGAITKIWIPAGGPYDLQGSLRVRVAAPYPLQLISGMWQFHDANWFPDFQTSATKLAWFYERSGGSTPDGVIAINAKVVQDILRFIGPIEMPEYGKIITADNFLLETQKSVELEYDKTMNQPKKFIADLVPRFVQKLSESFKTNYLDIVDTVMANMASKDIQLAFRDPSIEEKMKEYGWAGEIKNVEPGTDYLSVINANIAGGKSDAKMHERILHRADIASDGSLVDTVVIIRKHEGANNELFSGVQNVDYMRVYVPEGSTLLEASGFVPPPKALFDDTRDMAPDADLARTSGSFAVDEKSGTVINNEFGKTVFGNWVQTKPGEESIVLLRYRLPWKLQGASKVDHGRSDNANLLKYSLLTQKQSGIQSEFHGEVSVPDVKAVLSKHPDTWRGDGHVFEVNDILSQDTVFSVLLK